MKELLFVVIIVMFMVLGEVLVDIRNETRIANAIELHHLNARDDRACVVKKADDGTYRVECIL